MYQSQLVIGINMHSFCLIFAPLSLVAEIKSQDTKSVALKVRCGEKGKKNNKFNEKHNHLNRIIALNW